MTLEANYRLDGESRAQELHDQLVNFQVTAADKYDPDGVIQELRLIFFSLRALDDVAAPAHKTHAFFRALPDEKNESLKTVLFCDRQRDGSSSSNFEHIAARATSYYAMEIRDKVSTKRASARRDENDGGSHESALNTTAVEEFRNSRRKKGGSN